VRQQLGEPASRTVGGIRHPARLGTRGPPARVQQRLRNELEVLLHVIVHHDLENDGEVLLDVRGGGR